MGSLGRDSTTGSGLGMVGAQFCFSTSTASVVSVVKLSRRDLPNHRRHQPPAVVARVVVVAGTARYCSSSCFRFAPLAQTLSQCCADARQPFAAAVTGYLQRHCHWLPPLSLASEGLGFGFLGVMHVEAESSDGGRGLVRFNRERTPFLFILFFFFLYFGTIIINLTQNELQYLVNKW